MCLAAFWYLSNYLTTCLFQNAMELDLPSDDDGTGLLPVIAPHATVKKSIGKTDKKKGRNQKPKPKAQAKSSSSSAADQPLVDGSNSGFSLPSDDEGDLEIEIISTSTVSARPSARTKAAPGRGASRVRSPGGPEVQGLDWDSDTLKSAAAAIESNTSMPYLDLQQMIQQGQHATLPPDDRDHLWEVYSMPRMTPKMRELGGKASRSYDLAHYFNLSEVKYQRLLIQDITLCRPRFLMLSPPCRYVCQLMHSNWNRMNPQLKMLNLVEACNHIDMSMWCADIQIQHDDEFGFEHPHLSLAWGRESATRWQINLFVFR